MEDSQRLTLALQEHARVMAGVARAMVEIAAMNAANQERLSNGEAIAYSEDSIRKVIESEGIGYNSVESAIQNIWRY